MSYEFELAAQIRRLAIESDESPEETVTRNIKAMEWQRAEIAELRARLAEADLPPWPELAMQDLRALRAKNVVLLSRAEAAETSVAGQAATIEMLGRELVKEQNRLSQLHEIAVNYLSSAEGLVKQHLESVGQLKREFVRLYGKPEIKEQHGKVDD